MNAMATDVRRTYTYADLERIPADGRRYEILAGDLLVTPAPRTVHQRVVVQIAHLLCGFAQKSGGLALVAPTDVLISDSDVLEPDVLYLGPSSVGRCTERFIQGAPDVVVEVLSPGTEHVDRGEKLRIYREAGVREYWIVDPERRFVELHDFPARTTVLLDPGRRLASRAAAGFSVDVAEFFATLP